MIAPARRFACTALLALSTAAVIGCSNEALPGPGPRVPDFTVRVELNGSTTPVYSWDAGDAASLRVSRTDAFSDIGWLIATENNAGNPVDNITSPITHGATPPGAQVLAANELDLTPNATYQVTVAMANGMAGFADFLCCN